MTSFTSRTNFISARFMANIVGDFDSFLAFVLSVPLGEIEIVCSLICSRKWKSDFRLVGTGFEMRSLRGPFSAALSFLTNATELRH